MEIGEQIKGIGNKRDKDIKNKTKNSLKIILNVGEMKPNCYIITGGVGFGKTTLVEELCKDEMYFKIPEIAAELIEEQKRIGGRLIPWIDRYAFEEELMKRRIEAYICAPKDKICFFDRGIPDVIAFLKLENKEMPKLYFEVSKKCRYSTKVFFVPPWKEIYTNNIARPQTYEESLDLSNLIKEAYTGLGYELVEIPKMTVKERVEFIKKNL